MTHLATPEVNPPVVTTLPRTLLTLATTDEGATIPELRAVHSQLVTADVQPEVMTGSLLRAVNSLMGMAGTGNPGTVSFVIRGDAVVTSEYLVLLNAKFASQRRRQS